ncbi:UPF0149 family protein [Tahibacter amnicola]|uniref:UPF0149 family protein n=1 Tax=Tahibacter amnicola TaxID=2976241 RepID=A0ABY6BB42_9GAMM|nr:UPF0149 family protein [Tahibacter amnicola]UXI66757.1 UPF0149 family protein [Tahibacter amnicola]
MNQPTSLMSPLTDDEVEQLMRFLDERAVVRDGMSLEMLDGFATALISGPEAILPSEWLPHVWSELPDEAASLFADEGEANNIIGLVIRHYNAIAGVLAQGGAEFSPWITEFELDDDVVSYGQDWALGYLRGVGLRQDLWLPLLDDPEWQDDWRAVEVLACGPDDESTGSEVETQEQRDELIDQMANFALDAHDFWLEARLTPKTQRRAEPKQGRNDLCRCGSGKKYKNCCGAAG